MTYLIDTNILSETRKSQPSPGVAAWITATPPGLMYISVLTVGEIEQGVARIRGRGDSQQAAQFERWLAGIEAGFADRILPLTLPAAKAWGRQSRTRPLPVVDALIAATAQVHGLTVVTRNVKDYEHTGVQVLNPFGN